MNHCSLTRFIFRPACRSCPEETGGAVLPCLVNAPPTGSHPKKLRVIFIAFIRAPVSYLLDFHEDYAKLLYTTPGERNSFEDESENTILRRFNPFTFVSSIRATIDKWRFASQPTNGTVKLAYVLHIFSFSLHFSSFLLFFRRITFPTIDAIKRILVLIARFWKKERGKNWMQVNLTFSTASSRSDFKKFFSMQ